MKNSYAMISTWKMSYEGMKKAKVLLESGASIKEAIVEAIMDVEDNEAFHSVGYGGLPNEEGIVELDAAYMDGDDLSFGAISGVQNIKSPILVASSLSKFKRNCFLTAQGAEQYAKEQDFAFKEMRTDAAYQKYLKKKQEAYEKDRIQAYEGHDTVCVIGKLNEHMGVGVSTSGLFMKHPGRVGDSPVIGSGFYCDSQIGGAAATGVGEDIMKGCLSVQIVHYMETLSPQEACEKALSKHYRRLCSSDDQPGDMSVIALNAKGEFGAATTIKEFPFVVVDKRGEPTLMVCQNDGQIRVFEADGAWIRSYLGD